MAYRFGQYTQPLTLQRQLGQTASTGNILSDLRKINLAKTKGEYSKDVREQMRAKAQKAARGATGIGKKFGILKTLAAFIPGAGPYISAALAGVEAKKMEKTFGKAGKGFGKYKGTFMGDETEKFAEGQKEQSREFDPFKAFATDLITGLDTSKGKHEVPGGVGEDFIGPLSEGAYRGPVEKMWKDMGVGERLGSLFPGGGKDGDMLSGLTRARTAFSPYLNAPKYTTNFYGD